MIKKTEELLMCWVLQAQGENEMERAFLFTSPTSFNSNLMQ